MSPRPTRVSVIIPAYNAETTLPRVLAALRDLPRDWELIVVDDHSTDGTAEIARRHGAQVLLSHGSRCDHAARNTGAAAARGEVLAFLDADVVASVTTIAAAARMLERKRVGCVFAVYDRGAHLGDLVSRYKNFWIRHSTLRAPRPLRWINTSLAVLGREHLHAVGGFPEAFTCLHGGGDLHFGARLARGSGPILVDERVEVTHLKRFTLARLARNDFLRARGWLRLALAQRGTREVLRRPRQANVGARFSWGCMASAAGLALLGFAALEPLLLAPAAGGFVASAVLSGDFLAAAARERIRGWPLFVPLLWFDQLACAAGLATEVLSRIARPLRRRAARPELVTAEDRARGVGLEHGAA